MQGAEKLNSLPRLTGRDCRFEMTAKDTCRKNSNINNRSELGTSYKIALLVNASTAGWENCTISNLVKLQVIFLLRSLSVTAFFAVLECFITPFREHWFYFFQTEPAEA